MPTTARPRPVHWHLYRKPPRSHGQSGLGCLRAPHHLAKTPRQSVLTACRAAWHDRRRRTEGGAPVRRAPRAGPAGALRPPGESRALSGQTDLLRGEYGPGPSPLDPHHPQAGRALRPEGQPGAPRVPAHPPRHGHHLVGPQRRQSRPGPPRRRTCLREDHATLPARGRRGGGTPPPHWRRRTCDAPRPLAGRGRPDVVLDGPFELPTTGVVWQRESRRRWRQLRIGSYQRRWRRGTLWGVDDRDVSLRAAPWLWRSGELRRSAKPVGCRQGRNCAESLMTIRSTQLRRCVMNRSPGAVAGAGADSDRLVGPRFKDGWRPRRRRGLRIPPYHHAHL